MRAHPIANLPIFIYSFSASNTIEQRWTYITYQWVEYEREETTPIERSVFINNFFSCVHVLEFFFYAFPLPPCVGIYDLSMMLVIPILYGEYIPVELFDVCSPPNIFIFCLHCTDCMCNNILCFLICQSIKHISRFLSLNPKWKWGNINQV